MCVLKPLPESLLPPLTLAQPTFGLLPGLFAPSSLLEGTSPLPPICIAGVLKFSFVLKAGFAGPGRGVVRLLSESSSPAEFRFESSEAVELVTGEQGSGAILAGGVESFER